METGAGQAAPLAAAGKEIMRRLADPWRATVFLLLAGLFSFWLSATRPGYAAAGMLLVILVAIYQILRLSAERRETKAPPVVLEPAGDDEVRRFADAMPDPLVVFGRNAEVVFANQAAREVFGEFRRGASFRLRFRTAEMMDLVDHVLKDGKPRATDYSERSPLERRFRVTASPLAGTPGHFLATFSDRTEVWRMERMRSDFIANASHELRTPLASVSGFIETLRGPARDDAKARERFLGIMQSQTDRMARLIDDLLSLSRLEMKPVLRSRQPVDLASLVERLIGSLSHLAGESGVEISSRWDAAPRMVSGEEDELFQVFENLLANACKYGGSGGRVDVTASPASMDGKPAVAVAIRDYGKGIAREHLPRITERFYRVDADESRLRKGTGLGLAIVKHIVARHSGQLRIESEPGQGSTFTVVLPLA